MNNSQDNMAFVDAVIVGGGITGMAAAYYLQEAARAAGRPLAYVLVESNTRLGGKIATEHVDGFTIEGGPDCFISQKPWAAELCRQLGLGEELIGTNDERRKTFVLNHGRLTPLPDGVLLIVPTRFMPFVTSTLISWPGKIRMGMDLLLPRRKDNADESVASFVRRRLGREALDKIAEPLMGGIHVSDPEQQSLLGTFPRFRDLEMKHRSLILGMLASRRIGHNGGHGAGVDAAQRHQRRGPTNQRGLPGRARWAPGVPSPVEPVYDPARRVRAAGGDIGESARRPDHHRRRRGEPGPDGNDPRRAMLPRAHV